MITIKTPAEIAVMRKASQIVAEILEALVAAARPGVTTEELDQLAEELTYKKGAKTAFKGYKPGGVVYPKCLCVSINNEIVHGIPSSRARLLPRSSRRSSPLRVPASPPRSSTSWPKS